MLGASGGEDPRGADIPWLTPFPSTAGRVPTVTEQPGGQAQDQDQDQDQADHVPDGPPHRHPSRPVLPAWTPARVTQQSVQGDTSTNRILVPVVVAVAAAFLGAVAAVALVVADDGLATAALVVAGVGLAVAAAGGVLARSRLRTDIDQPLIELREAVLRLGAGEPAERVAGLNDGPLVPVARAVESAGATVSVAAERLVSRASWGESNRQILDALDFARTDSEVYRVVAEALELVDDEHPSELLMTPTGSSHELHEVAANTATGSPGCPVTHTEECLAIRRGQVVVTDSSEAINACPQLRGRPGGPCSAVCVPVGVEGQSVGVIHATAADRYPPEPQVVERLVELSRQVGTRLGVLRALESSRAEASTDGLTGLPNRRTLESELQQMLDGGRSFVAVLADLDKFKSLNDTFGHEAGDRALQLFARVMQDNVRGHDMVARVGGEEFVVVYPDMTVQGSIEAIERLRTGLASAVAVAAVQPFTCSFGVTHSSVGATVAEILRVSDAGLLRAKELGGDQVVYADQALAAEVFDPGDSSGPNRSV